MKYTEFIKEAFTLAGLDWRRFDKKLIRRRITAVMQELNISSFRSYASMLEGSPEEQARFRAVVTVTISRFFRDSVLIQALRESVLPSCVDECLSEGILRVWSAGCACGEEPYSLSILWQTFFLTIPVKVNILATDINVRCLERARQGIYGPGCLKEIPANIKPLCFESSRGCYCLKSRFRKMVEFRTDVHPKKNILIGG